MQKIIIMLMVWLFAPSVLCAEMSPTPLAEGFVLKSSQCQLAMVNLKNQGELVIDKGELFDIVCDLNPAKPFEVQCGFFQKGGTKPFAQKTMNAGINGTELFLEGSGDGFVANLASGLFYGDANVILNNGLVRGHKICGGIFLWQHETKPAIAAPVPPQQPKPEPAKTDAERFYRS